MHQLGHFFARDKMGHFVGWDNLSAKKCQWDNGLLMDMPEILPKIYPKYARDTRKLSLKVWVFKLRKWDKMSPGRVHQLGHYVAGEVRDAVGHFVVGTFCLNEANLIFGNMS